MTAAAAPACPVAGVWEGLMSIEREVVEALADVWDRGPDTIWEPVRFEVGDRVRVRLSGECKIAGEPGGPMATYGVVGCPLEFDGLSGVVADVTGWRGREPIQGHHIHVLFDEAVLWQGHRVKGDIFAACELIPLDGSR